MGSDARDRRSGQVALGGQRKVGIGRSEGGRSVLGGSEGSGSKGEGGGGVVNATQLGVFLRGRRVGTLAQTDDGVAAFEYDPAWITSGFSISPLSLPLRSGVFVPEPDPFDGLFGVFQDSLPDGWGALLLDRVLRKNGVEPSAVSPMTMLALMGSGGRGGLCYRPEIVVPATAGNRGGIADIDAFSQACQEILANKPVADLDEAYAAGGSSAGARPKAYIRRAATGNAARGGAVGGAVDGAAGETAGETEWLVKFPSSLDPANVGVMEYAYSAAARDCGIDMAPTELLPSRTCGGYFATERFDRDASGEGVHMVTASGLLEVSHRFPVLDYTHLFQLTQLLTHDLDQTWQLFRLMCFNAFAHNQDDHSNNFAWLCAEGAWRLSPAYDLTYSTSLGNEHATAVNGSGNPTMVDLLDLGESAGLPRNKAGRVAGEIRARCNELLRELGVPAIG